MAETTCGGFERISGKFFETMCHQTRRWHAVMCDSGEVRWQHLRECDIAVCIRAKTCGGVGLAATLKARGLCASDDPCTTQ
jgi:hypothetical protein